jgi:Tfp pilus assembly protein PilV
MRALHGRFLTARRPRRRAGGAAGFTLLEVLIALLVAMVGLIGTVAVQQAVLASSVNSNDAALAMRLAAARLEELGARQTTSPAVDDLAAIATGAWSAWQFVDPNGNVSAAQTPTARFGRRIQVTNGGVGLPYSISVEVSYNLDSGQPRTVRLDMERRKPW